MDQLLELNPMRLDRLGSEPLLLVLLELTEVTLEHRDLRIAFE